MQFALLMLERINLGSKDFIDMTQSYRQYGTRRNCRQRVGMESLVVVIWGEKGEKLLTWREKE